MIKKIAKIIVALLICAFLFTACNKEKAGEEATIMNSSDSAFIHEDYSFISEQLSVADSSKPVASEKKLYELINNPSLSAVLYNGTEDISLNHTEYIDKTIIIKTGGSLTVESPVKTLIAEEINGSFSVTSKIDNIILKGTEITVDIKSDTGSVYIEGKNATVNISAKTDKVFAHNVMSVINNYSDNDVTVTLANGTITSVAPQKSYNVYENLIYDLG